VWFAIDDSLWFLETVFLVPQIAFRRDTKLFPELHQTILLILLLRKC
jgi:hypothetical protein